MSRGFAAHLHSVYTGYTPTPTILAPFCVYHVWASFHALFAWKGGALLLGRWSTAYLPSTNLRPKKSIMFFFADFFQRINHPFCLSVANPCLVISTQVCCVGGTGSLCNQGRQQPPTTTRGNWSVNLMDKPMKN
jgi:hypothetical protein